MAEASDVKNALADLGLKATVIYDYEVRERPRLLSSFKAIVVPRLSLEYLSLRYFNAAGADRSGEF
jgi:UDP-glucose 4-epimerase